MFSETSFGNLEETQVHNFHSFRNSVSGYISSKEILKGKEQWKIPEATFNRKWRHQNHRKQLTNRPRRTLTKNRFSQFWSWSASSAASSSTARVWSACIGIDRCSTSSWRCWRSSTSSSSASASGSTRCPSYQNTSNR